MVANDTQLSTAVIVDMNVGRNVWEGGGIEIASIDALSTHFLVSYLMPVNVVSLFLLF